MEEQLIDVEEKPKRPGFLVVLCVLSWIAAAMSVIQGLINLIFYEARKYNALLQLEQSKEQIEDMPEGGFKDYFLPMMDSTIELTEKFFFLSNLTSVVFYGLSALGAFWMFKLLKKGFYTYAFAHTAMLLSMILTSSQVASSGFMTSLIIITGFFTLLFIGLYAIYLKRMK